MTCGPADWLCAHAGREVVIPRLTSARLVGLATALVLVVSAVSAPPALARAGCNNGGAAGTADIGVTQALSGPLPDLNDLDTVTITNYGPCNVPNVGLAVALPGTFVSFTSNPSSWSCEATTNGAKCAETSTIGVPGTAVINIEYHAAAGTAVACAATFTVTQPSTPADCSPNSGPVPDQNPGNNTSYAATLGVFDQLIYGPLSESGYTLTPNRNFQNTTALERTGGSGNASVQIYQTPLEVQYCPLTVSDCFLGTITVVVSLDPLAVDGSKTWTLTFLASLAGKKSLSQITIWNSVGGGAYTALSNCSAKKATDPCVQSRSRSTNADGDTVYTIVVVGTQDNGMTAD
jgi:hypothetical protein